MALETGVASVTLTAVADRTGVHHSAVRRYFSAHKDVLAAEGWTRWSDIVRDALRAPVPASTVAEALARGLDDDPLFCVLANVPLHLEHEVDIHLAAIRWS